MSRRLSGGFPVWSAPAFHSREFSSLRLHYQWSFERLVRLSQSSVERSSDARVTVGGAPRSLLAPPPSSDGPDEFFQASRYDSEYEEKSFIARGGFGAVYRATNKLDGCDYAVKKVLLKYCDRELCAKILREVTTLARLSHSNVVSYKTAWLEPVIPSRCVGGPSTRGGSRAIGMEEDGEELPDGSSSWSPGNSETTRNSLRRPENNSSSSSGVVFEASADGKKEPNAGERGLPISSIPSQNVLSIQEVEDEEDLENDLPRVTGLPATPPNHEGGLALRRGVSFDLRVGDEDEIDGRRNPVVLRGVGKDEPDTGLAFRASCKDKALLYLQMQLCDLTLRQWLDDRNQKEAKLVVSEAENARIFRQILKGTTYIHSQKIIHRDLKPKNIFLSNNNTLVGLCREVSFLFNLYHPSVDDCRCKSETLAWPRRNSCQTLKLLPTFPKGLLISPSPASAEPAVFTRRESAPRPTPLQSNSTMA